MPRQPPIARHRVTRLPAQAAARALRAAAAAGVLAAGAIPGAAQAVSLDHLLRMPFAALLQLTVTPCATVAACAARVQPDA